MIALFAGEQAVLDHLRNANEVFIPSIVIGELSYGAHKSSRVSENLRRIEDFVASNFILECDAATAFQYGSIKDQLRQSGNPIPENDIWIAAIALQFDSVLVSRDVHFKNVQALHVEAW